MTIGKEMVDNTDLIKKCEDELWQIINRMHKAGVRYVVIHGILEELTKTVELQSYAKDWLNQHNK